MTLTVGIVTVHDIYNYGSVLQAFATQHMISTLGYDVEIIDYKYPNPRHVKGSRPRRIADYILRVGNAVLKDALPGRPYTTYKERYQQFKTNHYRLSRRSYPTVDALMVNPPQYDIYVAGSDQIWRPEYINDDPCFFLDFVRKGRRIAYASSFGCLEIPPQYHQTYRRYLSAFSHLGVREFAGQAIVKQLTGRDAAVVLDPTLLMTGEQWKPYAKPFAYDKPYIACYGLSVGDRYMEELALHIAKLTGYKIVRINGKFHDYFARKMEYVLDAGPAEWMGILANASLILGQSFHAVAFSINFQRPFYTILQDSLDSQSRQTHILRLLGLEHRAVHRHAPFPSAKDLELEVDFTQAIGRLDAERVRSLDYMVSALRG